MTIDTLAKQIGLGAVICTSGLATVCTAIGSSLYFQKTVEFATTLLTITDKSEYASLIYRGEAEREFPGYLGWTLTLLCSTYIGYKVTQAALRAWPEKSSTNKNLEGHKVVKLPNGRDYVIPKDYQLVKKF